MNNDSTRRNFLATGLALPVAGVAATTSSSSSAASSLASPSFAAGGLKYKVIGKTGLKVTNVAFGCMITSDPSVIARALDAGINYFDTARVYQGGNNERMVGAALKGKRNDIILSSKTKALTKAEAMQHLETSLKELQTDHLDIWYLHDKGAASDILDDLIDAQQTAKKQGKIRFAGISNHKGHADLLPAVAKKGAFDVLLTAYNFTMGATIDPLLAQVHKAGVGIVGMKVMAGGYRIMPFYPTTETTRNMLRKEGALLAALKWTIRNPNIDTTIPSMVDADQLEENLKAMASPFTKADEKLLAAHLQRIQPLYCRMCGSCSGVCPKGLPASDMLRILSYADGYGQFPMARERFLELPEEVRQVRCGDCTACAIQCPNGVKVSERLARAQELFA